jgi:hypothetical protein
MKNIQLSQHLAQIPTQCGNIAKIRRWEAMNACQDQFAKGTESLPNGENRRIYREQRPSSTISGPLACPSSAGFDGFISDKYCCVWLSGFFPPMVQMPPQ